MLGVRGLDVAYGRVQVLRGVSLRIERGELVTIVGPNGAGKTTIFNMISGVLAPSAGRMLFEGEPLPVRRPHAVAGRGIARTFQLVRLFEDMTVLENVLVGCHRRGRAGWLSCALRSPAMRREEGRLRRRAWDMLGLVGLEARADLPAAAVPYGEQRLVEVARALAMSPRLLLLDEPGAGLDAAEQERLAALIQRIRAAGTTVLLVDHHMDLVMDLSDEVLVLSYGQKLAEGSPAAVRRAPEVIAAYLGEDAA